jgi:hypothetical protein
VLDCDRIAADRVQILARVERPPGRPRVPQMSVHAKAARNGRQDQTLGHLIADQPGLPGQARLPDPAAELTQLTPDSAALPRTVPL